MKKTFLLDLDGTLTDPYTGISRCILHALGIMQAPEPAADEFNNWIGPPLKECFGAWFETHAIDADADEAVALYRERFSRIGLFENEVYPGIPGLLSDLAEAGSDIFLATSKPAKYAGQILVHFELEGYFKAVYGSDLDGRHSDKKELLAMIIEREKLVARDCIMIGDRHHDIHAARIHGMASIGVLWGYGSQSELEGAGADRIIDSVQRLATALLS